MWVRLLSLLLLLAGAYALVEKNPRFDKEQSALVKTAIFSPDNRFILSYDYGQVTSLWDATTGAMMWSRSIEGLNGEFLFSSDGNKIIAKANHEDLFLLETNTGLTIQKFSGHTRNITSAVFTPDGLSIMTGGEDRTVRLWDIKTGNEIKKISINNMIFMASAFSEDGKLFAYGSSESTAHLLDTTTGEEIKQIISNYDMIRSLSFSPDGRFLLSGGSAGATLWDIETGKEVKRFAEQNNDIVTKVGFLPKKSHLIVTESYLNTPKIWDIESGEQIGNLNISRSSFFSFSPDGQFLLSSTLEKGVSLIELKTNEKIVRFTKLHNSWISQTSEGYYVGQENVENYMSIWHYFRFTEMTDTDIARWRRPDLVAAALQRGNPPPILATTPSSTPPPALPPPPPGIDILSPAERAEFGTEPVRLTYRLRPDGGPVTQVLALIDGQPLAMQARSTPRVETEGDSITLTLPPRDVTVTLLARGPGGDGPSMTRRMIYKPPATKQDLTKPDLFVLAVGISDYADSAYRLNYADDDARELVKALRKQEGRLYRKVHVSPLPNARKDDIMTELFGLTRKVGSLDQVVILMAGHGALDTYNEFLFLPQDVQADKLEVTGLPQSEINRALKRIAGNVLLFLDACRTRTDGRRAPNVSFAGLNDELSRDGKAVAIINAAQDGQASLEDAAWGHGALTKALLEALDGTAVDLFGTGKVTADLDNDGYLSLNELDIWLTKRVAMLTGGRQHPKPRRTTAMPDIRVAQIGPNVR